MTCFIVTIASQDKYHVIVCKIWILLTVLLRWRKVRYILFNVLGYVLFSSEQRHAYIIILRGIRHTCIVFILLWYVIFSI